ncbi:hypothetical protein PTTG_00798 [Puccinia triticina 1-1 BBBD Race 1]|uniref:Uncharacterized protein n=1 Tax=Puccinia triticina (isolate 1-1 / race 1 (BBBD)) TaxID=630390 RepID=A0A180G201_PUCT1|nr:hypothetical protein PTTG_00798 [Puccinia triticina 1-1 BBBD Race 1]
MTATPRKVWEYLSDMHSRNQAADAYGHGKLGYESDDPDNGVGAPIADSDEDEEHLKPLEPELPRTAIKPRRRSKKRRLSDQLTAAELAMDSSTSDESIAPPTATATPKPVKNKYKPAVTPTPGSKGGIGRPPTKGGSMARRRGRTEEAPKKNDPEAVAMRAMIQSSQDAAATWMQEERTRLEQARIDQMQADMVQRREMDEARRQDSCDADARAAEKERVRLEALSTAKLNWEAAVAIAESKERAREAEIKADREVALAITAANERQRKADRKAEREEAKLERAEDVCRYEAGQALQEQSRQAFQTAMLAVMANLGAKPT